MVRADAPIPVADSTLLGGATRRTRIIRIVFAAALVAAVVAAFLVAPRHPGRRYLPAQAVGIVVLDVSSSVRPSTYYRIEQVLDSIAGSKGRLGLVLFSDTAYEALPPGTPARDLQPFLRFFAPQGPGSSQTYLAGSPWQQWFSAGTRISQGLFLAQHMLDRENAKKGAILLISDLADDPNDQDAAKQAVIDLEQKGVPVEIVGLDPSMQNANFWKRLLGAQAVYQTATLPTGEQAAGKIKVTNGFSLALFLFAALAVLVLAVNEWWAEPFRFQRRSV
jgi:hypothetical protein